MSARARARIRALYNQIIYAFKPLGGKWLNAFHIRETRATCAAHSATPTHSSSACFRVFVSALSVVAVAVVDCAYNYRVRGHTNSESHTPNLTRDYRAQTHTRIHACPPVTNEYYSHLIIRNLIAPPLRAQRGLNGVPDHKHTYAICDLFRVFLFVRFVAVMYVACAGKLAPRSKFIRFRQLCSTKFVMSQSMRYGTDGDAMSSFECMLIAMSSSRCVLNNIDM